MLYIIKQYRKLFTSIVSINQVGGNEGMSSDIDKAIKSSEILTLREYKSLLEKYKDNEAELNKAVSEGIKDELYRDGRVLKILKEYSDLSAGVVEETIEKKEEIKKELDNSTVVDSVDMSKAEKRINTDIFKRTLKNGVEGADVMALQEFLILKGFLKETFKSRNGEEVSSADGKFGNGTKKALQEFQKTIGYTSPDGVLTVSNTKTYKTLSSIKGLNTNDDYKGSYTNVYGRKATEQEVKETIDRSGKSLEALNHLNKNSDEFYKALEAYYDGGFRDDVISDMGGVFGWFKEAVGANNSNDYFEKMKTYENKIGDKEDKFNEELHNVLVKKTNSEGHEYTTRDESLGLYAIRDIIMMVVFQDLPLIDLRFNFTKNLVSHGVPMDKAKALKNWVDGGMEGKPDYSKENLDKISGKDSLSGLRELRSTLTAYGFSNKQIEFALKGDLKDLTEKQKTVLNTIINDRILPDLETLRIGGFNFIERWFDDKDDQIKNRINKLSGSEYDLGTIEDIVNDKEVTSGHDVTLRKVSDRYILSIDDYGNDSYKTFTSLPTDKEIKDSVIDYTKDELTLWNTEKSVSVNYGISNEKNKDNERFTVLKTQDNKYIIEKDGKFKIQDNKPTQNEINKFHDNDLDGFTDSSIEGIYDNNISIDEKLRLTGEILDLLKEQDTEDGFFGSEEGLREGIERVDSRYEYTKGINDEYNFSKRAIEILKIEDKELFKRFSIISVFESSDDFLKAFPASMTVNGHIGALKYSTDADSYVKILKQANENKEVREYLDIIVGANEDNAGMNRWKNYRLNNIPKHTGLTRINESIDRQFKYGEALDINSTGKQALDKMKSETTEKGGNVESKNILGNVVSGMILKAGITDITTKDLEKSITKKFESIKLEDLNGHVINTALGNNYSNDDLTTFPKLQFEKNDTHAFHTTINKEVVLFKKNGEKVTVTKVYEIYLRPECNNLLIIPGANSQLDKLDQADFNMDISSLKTKTVPVSLNMLRKVADEIKPDKPTTTDGDASSVPIIEKPITIPTVPNQPAI